MGEGLPRLALKQQGGWFAAGTACRKASSLLSDGAFKLFFHLCLEADRRSGTLQATHSWASHMLAAGADLAYVSNQLGHANPSITLRIYSHWVPGVRRITTAVLGTKNANNLQMEAATEEKENLGRP